jgi:hypothetical protein
MHKKLTFFPEMRPDKEKPPTKWELIAAAEYAKSPEKIEKLSRNLAFIREDGSPVIAKGGRHVRR